MGTTSEKLTYLNTTKGLIKDSINLTNANILSTDTFKSYATKLREGLIDIINNGTDDLYNSFPKATGTDTSVTLSNTYEAPMKLDYYGDTQQDSYTGKNKCGIPNQTTSINDVSVTVNDGEITLNGTASTNGTLYFTPIKTTILNNKVYINIIYVSGTVSTTNPPNFNVRNASTQAAIFSRNLSNENSYGASTFQNETEVIFGIYVRTGNVFDNYKFKPQVTIGTSEDYEYEPYVGGIASPNSDYPQDIKVVTRSQSISVNGKNFLSYTLSSLKLINTLGTWNGNVYTHNGINFTINDDLTIKTNGTASSGAYLILNSNLNLTNGTNYIINGCPSGGAYNTYALRLYTGSNYVSQTGNDVSFTYENQDLVRINVFQGTQVSDLIFKPMIRLASDSDDTYKPYKNETYTIDLGTIELCKMGDYQDFIKKSTGKNLFDKTTITNGKVIARTTGIETTNADYGATDYIPISGNTTFTLTGFNNWYTACYDKNKNYIGYMENSSTMITLSGTSYIRASLLLTNLNTAQIELGSIATTYEPYGKIWYKKTSIGKVVLDGSETYSTPNDISYSLNKTTYFPNNVLPSGNSTNYLVSHFSVSSTQGSIGKVWVGNTYMNLNYDNTNVNVNNFQTWLSSNNVTIYYALSTPTYTEITNTTLINQLETIKKSYEDKTYINVSGSLPSILGVTALSKE